MKFMKLNLAVVSQEIMKKVLKSTKIWDKGLQFFRLKF